MMTGRRFTAISQLNVISVMHYHISFIISLRRYAICMNEILKQSALKEITSQTDLYLVSLSSDTYVFEDKMTKY